MRNKVLLSTDIGSDPDDALSLLTILNNSEINLSGIYTVNGEVGQRAMIAKHMVNLANKKIPVCIGLVNPMESPVNPYSFYESYHIDDSFVDIEESQFQEVYKPLSEVEIIENGLEHMIKKLSEKNHIVLSIGPLTNIASLLRTNPNIIKNIEKLYIMGSRFPEGSMEHNFRYDSGAAQEVLNSNIPITLIPSNLCNLFRMPLENLSNFQNSELGKYVLGMVKAYVGEELIVKCSRELLDDTNFINFMKGDLYMFKPFIDANEQGKITQFKQYFLNNFMIGTPSLEKEDFWKNFEKFKNYLKDKDLNYSFNGVFIGDLIAKKLEELTPKEISINDVYVPYCFLNPDKLQTERKTVNCNHEGRTYITHGEKHEIVINIDLIHFKEYLNEYLK